MEDERKTQLILCGSLCRLLENDKECIGRETGKTMMSQPGEDIIRRHRVCERKIKVLLQLGEISSKMRSWVPGLGYSLTFYIH